MVSAPLEALTLRVVRTGDPMEMRVMRLNHMPRKLYQPISLIGRVSHFAVHILRTLVAPAGHRRSLLTRGAGHGHRPRANLGLA